MHVLNTVSSYLYFCSQALEKQHYYESEIAKLKMRVSGDLSCDVIR